MNFGSWFVVQSNFFLSFITIIMHQELKDREYYNGFIMNKSFRDWVKTCPKEYSWQMNQVTKDSGTYTFFLEEEED